MARSHRLSRRWCGTHQMYFSAWADRKQTKLGRCPECADEAVRAEAAAQRRAEKASSPLNGEDNG
jgi:hypothetical protein